MTCIHEHEIGRLFGVAIDSDLPSHCWCGVKLQYREKVVFHPRPGPPSPIGSVTVEDVSAEFEMDPDTKKQIKERCYREPVHVKRVRSVDREKSNAVVQQVLPVDDMNVDIRARLRLSVLVEEALHEAYQDGVEAGLMTGPPCETCTICDGCKQRVENIKQAVLKRLKEQAG